MRKAVIVLFLLLFPTTLWAQRDDDWRRRRAYRDAPRENAFELTPFLGYRWGGTIFADQTFVFDEDVDVAPSANFGVSFAIPMGDSGFKLELMANRQSSEIETGSGLFEPDDRVADIDVVPPIPDRGYARKFDEAMRGYRFRPARDADGVAVAGILKVEVTIGG